MELIDYFRLIKKHFSAIIIIILVTTIATAIITSIIPKKYTGTVILQSNQSFNIPNYSSSTQGQQNTSLNSIVGLANQAQFKKEVTFNLGKQEKRPFPFRAFEVSAQLIKESNLIDLSVTTREGRAKAKILADTASDLLISKVSNVMQDRTNLLIRFTQEKIRAVDSQLVILRKKIKVTKNKNLKDQLQKEIKLAQILDKLNSAVETRKVYSDFINRLELNNALSKTRLQVVYPAAAPKIYSSPKMVENLLLSSIIGFLLGVGLVGLFGKKDEIVNEKK